MIMDLIWILGIPVLITLVAAAPVGGNLLLTMALPFTAAGDILRKLSLSGDEGNLMAIGLYVALCISPLLLIRKEDSKKENALLVLASALMFWVMWLMVNPGQIPANLRNDVGKAIYAGTIYSVFITWGVLKLMLRIDLTIQANVYGALRIFLLICAVQFVLEGFGFGFSNFSAKLTEARDHNTALTIDQLMPTFVFLALDFSLHAVENAMVAWILVLGARLLTELEKDPYSEACHNLSKGIFKWCRKTIRLVAAANLALNLGQVVLAPYLVNVDFTLRIPALSLGLTFGMMALIRLLGQGKELKEDNDLFI